VAVETHFGVGAAFEPELESPFRDERAQDLGWDDAVGSSHGEDPSDVISPFGEGEGLPEDDEEAGSEDDLEQQEATFPAPSNLGPPFAPDPPPGASFPVRSTHRRRGEVAYRSEDGRRWGSGGRRFGASRGNGQRRHAGIDLYARRGDEVVACQDGTITAFYGFCCGQQKTSWALVVDHGDLVINYGEVEPDSLSRLGLSRGASVRAGQVIAHIGRNPGGSSMLHFETYAPGTAATLRWPAGSPPPPGLWDPTRYLLLLTPTPLSGAADQPVLRRGSRGPAVRRLQAALTAAGFPTVVDGDFGPSTEAAVRALQRGRGLVVDAVVGTRTWAALADVVSESEVVPPDAWDEVRLVDDENADGTAAGDFGLYDGLPSAEMTP
jgi:murein DD-endopeptidase MepM/ murein hydrolase activator NlpD